MASLMVLAPLPEIVNPQQLGLGLGMLTIASNFGIAIGPPAFGLLLDTTKGNFHIGFIILALISLGMLVFLRGLKTQGHKS